MVHWKRYVGIVQMKNFETEKNNFLYHYTFSEINLYTHFDFSIPIFILIRHKIANEKMNVYEILIFKNIVPS